MDEIEQKMMFETQISSSSRMGDELSYMIWASVVVTSKAFGSVEMKVIPERCFILIKIYLRWWATFKKMDTLREHWLSKAEKSVQHLIPNGWRVLIYYARDSKANSGSEGHEGKGDTGDDT
jgi:hypothetical protein